MNQTSCMTFGGQCFLPRRSEDEPLADWSFRRSCTGSRWSGVRAITSDLSRGLADGPLLLRRTLFVWASKYVYRSAFCSTGAVDAASCAQSHAADRALRPATSAAKHQAGATLGAPPDHAMEGASQRPKRHASRQAAQKT